MKKRLTLAAVALSALTLAGCATTSPTASYVAPEAVSASDANTLAYDAAEYLAKPLPPGRTTIVLEPPGEVGDLMTRRLITQLRGLGYGVREITPQLQQSGKRTTIEGVRVRYLVSPYDSGLLLRLQYRGVEAARYYSRVGGDIKPTAPFTIREAAK